MATRLFMAALLVTALAVPAAQADIAHPRLLLSTEDVELIAKTAPLPRGFDRAVQQAKENTDRYLQAIPDVPVPKDAGGGYTHEQHKRNSVTIQNAGFLYQVTGNKAYALKVRWRTFDVEIVFNKFFYCVVGKKINSSIQDASSGNSFIDIK